MTDITSLNASSAFKLLFENHPLPMWIYDLESLSFLAVNDAALEKYGYSQKEFLTKTIRDIRPPDDVKKLEENVRSERPQLQHSGVWRHTLKSGKIIEVEITSHKISYDGKEAVLVLAQDVSERLRYERALQQSEERYRKIMEKGVEVVVILSAEGRVVFCNAACFPVLGYTVEEMIGKRPQDILHPEDLQSAMNTLGQVMESKGISRSMEARGRHKAGHYFWMDNTLTNFMDEPSINGIVIHFRDISDKKAIEHQYLQSQKMESLGRLAGGIAHDFNNLLTIISGYSEMLALKAAGSNDMLEGLEQIRDASERASKLTQQLLAFSRKQILNPTSLDLNDVLENIKDMLARLLGEDIDLITKPAKKLKSMKADVSQLEQVIINLCVNARDAMEDGGRLTLETATVELDDEYHKTHPQVDPGTYVMLAVSDTGHGMDEFTRRTIFDPFFTTKEKGKGTGLGLATVYGIVKQSGGFIWVYSEPERGTTFRLYFPSVDERAQKIKKSADTTKNLAGNETILVVEDEDVVRELAVRILKTYGYRVLSAENGNRAIELYAEHGEKIDLVLTDIIMPKMSGKKLVEKLMKSDPELKVLYMSGYTDNAIVHRGILDEGVDFIQKPFSPNTLLKALRQVLDR